MLALPCVKICYKFTFLYSQEPFEKAILTTLHNNIQYEFKLSCYEKRTYLTCKYRMLLYLLKIDTGKILSFIRTF